MWSTTPHWRRNLPSSTNIRKNAEGKVETMTKGVLKINFLTYFRLYSADLEIQEVFDIQHDTLMSSVENLETKKDFIFCSFLMP